MIAFMVINIIAFIIQGVGAVLLGIAMAIFVTFAAAIQEDCSYNAFTKQCVCISNGKKIYFYLFDFPFVTFAAAIQEDCSYNALPNNVYLISLLFRT